MSGDVLPSWGGAAKSEIVATPAQARFASALVDVLIYVVVLNLFIEYAHAVVIDSFTVSVLTAILLWLMVIAIGNIEHRVGGYFRAKEGVFNHVLGYALTFAILFSSKFVILELAGFVFGGRAVLGHFVEIVLIIVAMIAARAAVEWIYQRLGSSPGEARRAGRPTTVHRVGRQI